MGQNIKIRANLSWRVFQEPEAGKFVGICDALSLTIEGDSWSDFMESVEETISAVMLDLVETGDFERFLMDRGWRLVQPMPVAIDSQTKFSFPKMDIFLRPESDFQGALCQ